MDSPHDYPGLSNTCIPSSVPSNVDPSLVDFREFYPYIPNEIKHRKRTTQAQLEVLEQTFAHDKKPNGVMRANLARQLDMTPRGVQVWFQNRRAKEKTLAKKAAAKLQQPPPPLSDSPDSQEGAGAIGSTSLEQTPSTVTDNKRPSLSPSVSPPALDALESSQDAQPAAPSILSARYDLSDPNYLNLRRGSLPIITRSTSDDYSRHRIQPTFDPLARRGSLGIDVSRLAVHPYAHLAAAANNGGVNGVYSGPGPVRGHRIHGSGKSNSLPGPKAAEQYGPLPHSYRSIPSHRASMPYVFSQGTPQSMETAFVPIKHSTPTFTSKYHDGLYCMPSRSIAEPIPGPLPNPNFSFGDSTASPPAPSPSTSESSEQLAAALSSYAFPSATDADQEEEVPPNASYGPFTTRFSSIASLADSESSITSAFYSEPGSVDEYPADFHPHSRRQSHVLDHFSNLGIEGHVTTSPTDSAKRSPEQVHANENAPGVNAVYTSRPSLSNGGSPHSSAKPVQYLLTSELASALSSNPDRSVPYDGTERYVEGARVVANPVISPPTLENAPLIGNVGRGCYENRYSADSYSIYNDTFDAPSKLGHYTVPPYGNGQSHGGLTNPTSIVPPVYSNQESTAVGVAAYQFGTSH